MYNDSAPGIRAAAPARIGALEAEPPSGGGYLAVAQHLTSGRTYMARRLIVAMALASSGLLASVSTAHADPTDDKFLSTLQSEGITDHVSPAHAIEAAHFVCVKLDNGVTPSNVVADVLNSSSMPAYHSGFFVGASIDTYCPRHKAEIPAG